MLSPRIRLRIVFCSRSVIVMKECIISYAPKIVFRFGILKNNTLPPVCQPPLVILMEYCKKVPLFPLFLRYFPRNAPSYLVELYSSLQQSVNALAILGNFTVHKGKTFFPFCRVFSSILSMGRPLKNTSFFYGANCGMMGCENDKFQRKGWCFGEFAI